MRATTNSSSRHAARALFTRFPLRGIKPEGNSWEDAPESATLIAYDFDQQRSAPVAQDVHKVRLSADHRTLVYESHDRMRAIDASTELPEDGQDDPRRRERSRPPQRLARSHPRERPRGTPRRVDADVRRSVADAARAVLGRADVRHRLGSRPRALRETSYRSRRTARGTLRHHVGNARRARHLARVRNRRRPSSASAVSPRLPRRRPRVERRRRAATRS